MSVFVSRPEIDIANAACRGCQVDDLAQAVGRKTGIRIRHEQGVRVPPYDDFERAGDFGWREEGKAMSEWQTINTARRDSDPILTYVCVAGQDIVRLAHWSDGKFWEMQGFSSQDELAGWWSYANSVSQEKLDGMYAPTHWAEFNAP